MAFSVDAPSEGQRRYVQPGRPFRLGQTPKKSKKRLVCFNIWSNQLFCYQIIVSKTSQNHSVFDFLSFSCLPKKCFNPLICLTFRLCSNLCARSGGQRRIWSTPPPPATSLAIIAIKSKSQKTLWF